MTRSHADPHLSRSAPWNRPSCLTQRFPLLAQAPLSQAIRPRREEARARPSPAAVRPAQALPSRSCSRPPRSAPKFLAPLAQPPPGTHRRFMGRTRTATFTEAMACPGPAQPRPAGAERRARPRPCRYGDPPPRRPAPAAMGAAQGQTTARGAAPPGPARPRLLPRPRVAPLCRVAAPGRRSSSRCLYGDRRLSLPIRIIDNDTSVVVLRCKPVLCVICGYLCFIWIDICNICVYCKFQCWHQCQYLSVSVSVTHPRYQEGDLY